MYRSYTDSPQSSREVHCKNIWVRCKCVVSLVYRSTGYLNLNIYDYIVVLNCHYYVIITNCLNRRQQTFTTYSLCNKLPHLDASWIIHKEEAGEKLRKGVPFSYF